MYHLWLSSADLSPAQRRMSISSVEELDENYPSIGRGRGTLGKLSRGLSNLRGSLISTTSGGADFEQDHTIWNARSDYAYDTRLLYKRRITTLYISFTNLRSYVEVNYSGFRKAIKKYDKVTESALKEKYLHDAVEVATPFTQAEKDALNDAVNRLVEIYTKCISHGDKAMARQQLRLHQRENIAWERDTVWRQMIGRERRGEGVAHDLTGATLVHGSESALAAIPTPVGRFRITKRRISMLSAVAVFVLLLNVPILQEQAPNRCLAILSFCTVLWATEVRRAVGHGYSRLTSSVKAIPLFVTSMFVPLLLVVLRVICDAEGVQMTPPKATK